MFRASDLQCRFPVTFKATQLLCGRVATEVLAGLLVDLERSGKVLLPLRNRPVTQIAVVASFGDPLPTRRDTRAFLRVVDENDRVISAPYTINVRVLR